MRITCLVDNTARRGSRLWAEHGLAFLIESGTGRVLFDTGQSGTVLMVTDPTPFGLHDLRLAVEVARNEMGLPVGVVINRDGVGDRGVDVYCADEDIPILMRIPLDRRIAEAYSEGVSLVEARPEYRDRFATLWERMEECVHSRRDKANESNN